MTNLTPIDERTGRLTGSLASTSEFDLFQRATDLVTAHVTVIRPRDWRRPTPNAHWDVTHLVAHLTGEQMWAELLIDGASIEQVGDSVDRSLECADLSAAWKDAVSGPKRIAPTVPSDATVTTSHGAIPAAEFLMEMFVDHLVHAWDLAASLGTDRMLPPDLVQCAAQWFADMEDAWRDAGAIGPRVHVSDAADAQTKFLAAFGRIA